MSDARMDANEAVQATPCPECGQFTLTLQISLVNLEEVVGIHCSTCQAFSLANLTKPAHHYMCEVCGKKLTATSDEAFNLGWDTPPHFTTHVTCDACPISGTMWYMLMLEQQRKKRGEQP